MPELRGKRLDAVMTQEELARRAGVAEGTIVSAEHGKKVRISTVRKLAEALGVAPQDLLGESKKEGAR